MNIPQELKYTEDHEWVSVEGDVATVGITEYAQGELGNIVFVELPDVESETTQKESFGSIEAVKAVSDMFAPVSGTVVDVNAALENSPETINSDPYGDGWIIKIKMSDPAELEKLLSADAYEKLIQ